MPEQLAENIRRQLRVAPWPRRLTWSMACVLTLCGIPAAALAQSAPAALRACAAEPDSAKRLACYDRAMARLSATPARPAAGPAEPDFASRTPPAPAPSSAPAQPPHTAVEKSAGPEGASPETPAPHRFSPWKIFTGGPSARVTAHVASLDRSPNTMVLHLDNGQVWRQIGRASGDLSLRAGDSVTIEKHLGSYWLSSRYISNMQVRLEPQQAQ